MDRTDHLLLEKTASRMALELTDKIENQWHTGGEYDELVWKRDRLERFKEYVNLHRQFNPEP